MAKRKRETAKQIEARLRRLERSGDPELQEFAKEQRGWLAEDRARANRERRERRSDLADMSPRLAARVRAMRIEQCYKCAHMRAYFGGGYCYVPDYESVHGVSAGRFRYLIGSTDKPCELFAPRAEPGARADAAAAPAADGGES